MSHLTDASDQTAEHNDAINEDLRNDRDAYLDSPDFIDDRPTKAELDREEFWRGRERYEEYWGAGE